MMIDEPEAFLHPPQARLLGQLLADDRPHDRQTVIATHSGDLLRGLLDSGSKRVRVIRLTRENTVNRIAELTRDEVTSLWSDSLLRHSNVLDGLFHEKVVVCESDSDARFYAAVLSANSNDDSEYRIPDIMFTHGGGKSRIPQIARALTALAVPVVCVVDFDVLSEENPLRQIFEAVGGGWDTIVADWKRVKVAIDAKRAEMSTDEVKREVSEILNRTTARLFPPKVSEEISRVFRRASPWAVAKEVGERYVPRGEIFEAYRRVATALERHGVYLVAKGEVERFAPSIASHGPEWVAKVIESKDLRIDPELADARAFVSRLI
jgi:hypothetical protein